MRCKKFYFSVQNNRQASFARTGEEDYSYSFLLKLKGVCNFTVDIKMATLV